MKKFGYFKPSDPQFPGLRYGNWGSRPFEYFWTSCVEPVEGLDVLDIGTGLPSEHNWHEHVRDNLKPKSYLGFDFDSRIKLEEINTPTHKVRWMDASNLQLPDNSIDLVFSISTFEHIDNFDLFKSIMKETARVMRPGAKMVLTLDEYWDWKDQSCLPWNELERARVRVGVKTEGRSYGICDFAEDIAEWFEPCDSVPVKNNADNSMLYSPVYNDCVSYGVFKVKK
jgi:ubiquinone/menaquinone biosynthesis C-methylase UbiE